jgi:hypothetical protein
MTEDFPNANACVRIRAFWKRRDGRGWRSAGWLVFSLPVFHCSLRKLLLVIPGKGRGVYFSSRMDGFWLFCLLALREYDWLVGVGREWKKSSVYDYWLALSTSYHRFHYSELRKLQCFVPQSRLVVTRSSLRISRVSNPSSPV